MNVKAYEALERRVKKGSISLVHMWTMTRHEGGRSELVYIVEVIYTGEYYQTTSKTSPGDALAQIMTSIMAEEEEMRDGR